MTWMILNPRQILDQIGHAWQRPEGGFIAMSDGPFYEGIGNLLSLLHRKFGFGPRRPFASQGRASALLPSIFPTVGHLPGYTQTACNLWRKTTFLKEPRRFSAALLHLGMISRLRHAQTITHSLIFVTLLCDSQ
jgi:hypothetical protein